MLESELVSPFADEKSANDCFGKRASTHRSKEKPLSRAANWVAQVVLLDTRAPELPCHGFFCKLETQRIQSKLILVILALSEGEEALL